MKTNHILALLAIAGGLFAAFTDHAGRNHFYPTWKYENARIEGQKMSYMSAMYLADLLYHKEQVTILDVRDEQAFLTYHIPRSHHLKEGDPFPVSDPTGPVIIYGSEGDQRAEILARDLPGKVHVLKGGIDAWYSLVLFPDFTEYHVRNRDSLKQIVVRSRYFGGNPVNSQLLNIDVRESRFREGC